MVPFAVEDGGRLGAYAIVLLRALEVVAIEKERRPPFCLQSREDGSSHSRILVGLAVVGTHVLVATPSHFKTWHQAHVPRQCWAS